MLLCKDRRTSSRQRLTDRSLQSVKLFFGENLHLRLTGYMTMAIKTMMGMDN